MDAQNGADEDLRARLPLPEERPGQYVRLRVLGRGAQSVVYLARDELLGRLVALKELAPSELGSPAAATPAAVSRFIREAQLVARLDHPGIVSIIELMRRPDGTLVSAQKLIAGETLKEKLGSAQTLEQRLRLVPNILAASQAVAFAHARRVIHRDLKPNNVMIGSFGETIVVDWGLAKVREAGEIEPKGPDAPAPSGPDLTLVGDVLGSPGYMSPEQASGKHAEVDERSDVFSLGAILYEILTGGPPFQAQTDVDAVEAARRAAFVPILRVEPEAPAELAAVAERALSLDPFARYPDAGAFAHDIASYLSGGRVSAFRYGAWRALRKYVGTHPALSSAVAVLLGAIVVVASLETWRLQEARVELARSMVARARAAEREADFAGAAAFFAASLTYQDTPAGRWGLSIDLARAPRRLETRVGTPGEFTDVTFRDGQGLVLAVTETMVAVRALDGGQELWRRELDPVLAAAFVPGHVRVSRADGWEFYDERTGALTHLQHRVDGRPCLGPTPPPAVSRDGRIVSTTTGRVLSKQAWWLCAVSDDGARVAFLEGDRRVRVVDLQAEVELAQTDAPDARAFFFTPFGLVVVDASSVHLLADGVAPVRLDVPQWTHELEWGGLGGAATSWDGRRIVVSRVTVPRAEVIDLQLRAVVASLRLPAGWPRFSFSPDNGRIFAAGLDESRLLTSYRLSDAYDTGEGIGKGDASYPTFVGYNGLSADGRSFAIGRLEPPAVEVWNIEGGLEGTLDGEWGQSALSGDGRYYALAAGSDATSARVFEVASGNQVLSIRCRQCRALRFASRSSRLMTFGPEGAGLWSVPDGAPLCEGGERSGGSLVDLGIAVSPDASRIAWGRGGTVVVRDCRTGGSRSFISGTNVRAMALSEGSEQLALATEAGIEVWDLETLRRLWLQETISRQPSLAWSVDQRSVLVSSSNGSLVLSARNGEVLVNLWGSNPVNTPARDVVFPNLTTRLSMFERGWKLRTLPAPETRSPREALRHVLDVTGQTFHGGELRATPGGRR